VTAALVAGLLFAAQAHAAAPIVKATWANEVTATSFRAHATVNPGGVNTNYHFDYIPASVYEANVAAGHPGFEGASRIPIGAEAKLFASATDQEAIQRIAGLSGDTPYRYRIVVNNVGGGAIGPVRAIRTQESSPDFSLAEGRKWEMVSPIDKNGGSLVQAEAFLGGGDLQAAAQGGLMGYSSPSSWGAAQGNPNASQYLSTRSPSGWSTQNLTLPTEASAFGPEPDGVPFRLLSADLSRALVMASPHEFLLLGASGQQLASLATEDLRFAGATPDLSHLVFSTCAALTPDATEVPAGGGCNSAFPNLYELSPPDGPRLLNVEPGQSVGAPGAALAAQSGAISSDGSRVYWTDLAGSLLLRDGNRTLAVDLSGSFQIAGADGAVAHYTRGGHLYRYSVATETSTDITPSGGVAGVLGASSDGSRVYFLDGAGVELWHAGTVTPVAATADPSSYPPATGTARVSADGTKLAFLASAPLTNYDSNEQNELFRYDDDTGSLLCASCNPTGARAVGPTLIPGAVANGEEVRAYKPRVMDATGSRLFFDTDDSLAAKDTNQDRDVYEWRADGVANCSRPEGCVGLISSGRGANGATFVDASAEAADVFFLTDESLVASDPGATDLYDARIGGGFPEPASPIPCFGDACQPLPPEPEDPTPGTEFYGSERNSSLHLEKPRRAAHRHRKKRHGKHHHRGHPRHRHGSGRRAAR
jgi:hypothetical protein